MTDGIVIATSIPPKLSRRNAGQEVGEDYQLLCVQSWLDCGFRILSVNDAEEIPALRARFPFVEFVETQRNASAISGRKTPYVADLLAALAAQPEEIVGIANADIMFEPTPQWRTDLPSACRGAVVTGHRLDTSSLFYGACQEYGYGFDYFFFERPAAGEILPEALPYAVGVPWWDYWVPLSLALTGRTVSTCTRPRILHLAHEAAWNARQAKFMARTFAHYVLGVKEKLAKVFPSESERLVSLSSAILTMPNFSEEPSLMETNTIIKLAKSCSALLGATRINLNMPQRTAQQRESLIESERRLSGATAKNVFETVDDRIEAKEILERILALPPNAEPRAFETLFEQALRKAPNEPDILYYAGLYEFDRKRPTQAIERFHRSYRENPNSGKTLNSLAMALLEVGDVKNAVVCLGRSLDQDPTFAESYRNLAIIMKKLGAQDGSTSKFEKMIDSMSGKASLAHIRTPAIREYLALRRDFKEMEGLAWRFFDEYYGENGEDVLLDEFFEFKTEGYSVDVGAFDGIYYSNTYAFERRGWLGLCIEPSPDAFRLCTTNRPRSTCLNVACSNVSRTQVAFYVERSGLFSSLTPAKEQIAEAYSRYGLLPEPSVAVNISEVRLEGLLANAPAKIDFIAIAIGEGAIDVLEGLNIDERRPRVLLVKTMGASDRKKLDEHLSANGYFLARSLANSHFYVRSKEDRSRLRSITVAAKRALLPDPMGVVLDEIESSDEATGIFWPSSPDD